MCEQTSFESFWDRSWKVVDTERITAYADRLQPDQLAVLSALKVRGAKKVCDAGCGCGVFSVALAAGGFLVSGFDISSDAVFLAQKMLKEHGYCSNNFRRADIRETGYENGEFDAVVALDVIDHMPIKDGMAAVEELLRITRPGGCVLLTLDKTDSEYESEPHKVSADGDYFFTAGKWAGMVFHPYSPDEIEKLTHDHTANISVLSESGYLVMLELSGSC